MPWEDWKGSLMIAAISFVIAEWAFQQGRGLFRTGLAASSINLAISIGGLLAGDGWLAGGWLAVPYLFAISTLAYFVWLGACATFRPPKNVKCFRCNYVDWPCETNDPQTGHAETEWRQFQKLAADLIQVPK